MDITALYLSDLSLRGAHDPGFGRNVSWDIDLLGGYDARFMGQAARSRTISGFFSMVGPQLWPEIRGGEYDCVVVHGHNLACHYLALAAARCAGVPVFLRAETHLQLKRSRWREAVRGSIIRRVLGMFDGMLAIGTQNARYYQAMGVERHRIFSVPYTVDNDRFASAARLRQAERHAMITQLGLNPGKPVILYAAKFDARKRPADLLSAYRRLRESGIEAQLAMVGSGALDTELKRQVDAETIPDVAFPGFVNQKDLPIVYGASDVFVLPSENEPWGLAVNEAMAAGLPVVVSREIGCAEDLIYEGLNGYTYQAGDVGALTEALRAILSDPQRRRTMADWSRSRMRQWSYRECAAGLREAIEAVHRGKKLSVRRMLTKRVLEDVD